MSLHLITIDLQGRKYRGQFRSTDTEPRAFSVMMLVQAPPSRSGVMAQMPSWRTLKPGTPRHTQVAALLKAEYLRSCS